MPYLAEPSLARIRDQVVRMRAAIQSPDALVPVSAISNWSPAEHIDHCTKVAMSVVNRLTNREPLAKSLTFIGRAVLFFDWIPRGRGRSPSKLAGSRETPLVLETALAKFEEVLATVSAAEADSVRFACVPHPRFGGLTPQQALRFVAIHTDHHLKIVDEIFRSAAAKPPL